MRINFVCNEVRGGWEPTDTRLGGTERGVVEWAEELAKRGHEVTVYLNRRILKGQNAGNVINGVHYTHRTIYGTFGEADICINVKSPEISPIEPTIFYTNDVDADKQDLSAYDAVIHISEWAAENIGANNPHIFVVPHGYDETKIYPDKKVPKQCIYTSSPDRGLDTLLRAWLKVVPQHPDATLLVTYGANGPEIPGVTYLGDVSEEEMNRLYRESDIWCHPANGGELQCIAGLKAQAAGCWPVIIPTMALSETVKFGSFATKENYAETLIRALDKPFPRPDPLPHQITIKESTGKLLEVVNFVYGNTSRRPA